MFEVWTPAASGHSKQKQFEISVVRQLHRTWFPSTPFKVVEQELEGDISWDNYSNLIQIESGNPDWTFIRDDKLWELNLHTLLKASMEKLPLLKHWEEQPSDGLIFPLVGSYGLLRESKESPNYSHVVKFTKDGTRLVLEHLSDYAKSLKVRSFLEV